MVVEDDDRKWEFTAERISVAMAADGGARERAREAGVVWEGEEGVRHLGEGIRARRDGHGMGTGHTSRATRAGGVRGQLDHGDDEQQTVKPISFGLSTFRFY